MHSRLGTTIPAPVSGWKRPLYCLLGCCCVGLGYLGVIFPGLPTTPFLILAGYFFVRSSPRLHGWLRRSPWVGRVLRDWEEHRGIRPTVKVAVCCMVVVVVTITIMFSGFPWWAKVLVIALAAIGLVVVLCVPTVRTALPPRDGAHQETSL